MKLQIFWDMTSCIIIVTDRSEDLVGSIFSVVHCWYVHTRIAYSFYDQQYRLLSYFFSKCAQIVPKF